MLTAPLANAQANGPNSARDELIIVTDCADLPVVDPNTTSGGATVTVLNAGNCLTTSGDTINLQDDNQDQIRINFVNTTVTNTDGDDEDVVVFQDNSENFLTVFVDSDSSLIGTDGVIFIEGDAARIRNEGLISNQGGGATEGAIYIDRDTDGNTNFINNGTTGTIESLNGGPAIGIETLVADGTTGDSEVGVQNPF